MAAPLPDPKTTAVLFIECMNGLLGEDSVMKAIRDAARPKIPDMARLANGARQAGAQVVHLTYFPVANNRSQNRRPPLFARLAGSLEGWHRDHPAVQPIPEIGVGPDDLVLPRNTGLSPTYGTETYKLLRNVGIRTIILAGISVNIAIPVAMVEACDEDFDVTIVPETVAGSPAEHAESMLKYTLSFAATITPLDTLLAGWGVAG